MGCKIKIYYLIIIIKILINMEKLETNAAEETSFNSLSAYIQNLSKFKNSSFRQDSSNIMNNEGSQTDYGEYYNSIIKGLASTNGLKGDKGDKGEIGMPGLAGIPGRKGLKGQKGLDGVPGPKGDIGIPGRNGIDGAKGDMGLRGPPGSNGLSGRPGEPGPPGVPGYDGSKGEMGIPGRMGIDGAKGDMGLRGPTGLNGRPGEPGLSGAPGYVGSKGDMGIPGRMGIDGAKGDMGLRGPPGLNGKPGEPGLPGPPGEPGQPGQPGQPGWPGLPGEPSQPSLLSLPSEELKSKLLANGQKWAPAKTCHQLFTDYPELKSSHYWIDPSETQPPNGNLLFCNRETQMTCITPKFIKTEVINYQGNENEIWLSEIWEGISLEYEIDSYKLQLLQQLSSHSVQKITFHCKNTVAFEDNNEKLKRRGLKLLTWNDIELKPEGSHHLRFSTTEDGCKYLSREWNKTVIEYKTEKPQRLPIVDIAIRDLNESKQDFRIEVGPVCFY